MYIFIHDQLTELHCTLLNTMSKKKKKNKKKQQQTFRLHDLDHEDTKSKLSVSVYCQNHSRRFHSWYKTHMKTLNIGEKKNTTA